MFRGRIHAFRRRALFEVSKPQLRLDRTFADYHVARDGRILLVVPPSVAAGLGQINVVLNWFEDVRAKIGKVGPGEPVRLPALSSFASSPKLVSVPRREGLMMTNLSKRVFTHATRCAVAAVILAFPVLVSGQNGVAISIDHIALQVANVDTSVAVYSGVFGLQEIPAAAKGRRWLSLGGGVALHLLDGRTTSVADNRSVHIALTSRDLEPILQQLRERRVEWFDFAGKAGAISTVRTDGVRQIFLRDPDGYWIEVNDALKNSSH